MVPQSYFDYARGRESGGNDAAKNPSSSATGRYQFTDGTWGGLMRRYPQLGLTPDGRSDPSQQESAMRAFTGENANTLQSKGYEPSNTNLYLAHRFGPQGALTLLQADPSSPVSNVVSRAVLQANPDLNGKTVGALTGASGMPTQREVVPQQRYVQGVQPSPGSGALSPSNMVGPGALSDDNTAQTIGTGMQQAGAWLSSISNPAYLGALPSLGPKPGRYQTQYDAKTGRVLTIDTQTGRAVANQDPNFDPNREAKQKYDEAQAKSFSDMNDKVYQTAQDSQQNMAHLGELRKLVQPGGGVYQGAGGEWVSSAKNLANSVGLKTEGLSDTQLVQSLANQLSLQMRNLAGGMPGSLSDKDLSFLKNMTVSLNNTPEANTQIVDRMNKVFQRMQDVNSLREHYVQQNGRIDEGFRRTVRAYSAANPLFDGEQDATPAASSSSQPAAAGFKVLKVH